MYLVSWKSGQAKGGLHYLSMSGAKGQYENLVVDILIDLIDGLPIS